MEDVCAVEDLNPNEPMLVRVEGREVVVVRAGDEIFAVRNVCPHQGQSFLKGHVRPRLTSDAPDAKVEVDASTPLLLCPWHTWPFSLRDGRCATDPTLRVGCYAVSVENGRVLVGRSGPTREHG